MPSFQSPELSVPLEELVQALLPSPFQGQLVEVLVASDQIAISLASVQGEADCPVCHQRSRHCHSRYARRVAELPWAGRTVQLTLLVRRFFCRNHACERKVFTERLPELVEPYARRTTRLRQLLTASGFALGGEAGARQAEAWGSAVSPDTLLNLLRRHLVPPYPTPRVLGVDDWSYRRGRQLGTLLVDLELHSVVDLLAESSEEAFAAWLRQHPGVEVISRDRGGAYASAGRKAAPDAVQVADRWQLLKNAADAVQKLLTRHAAVLRPPGRKAEPRAGLELAEPMSPPPGPNRRRRHTAQAPQSVQRQRQLVMFEQVHRLVAAGWSVTAIARELKLSKLTVRKYRDMESFRDGRTLVRVSDVEP